MTRNTFQFNFSDSFSVDVLNKKIDEDAWTETLMSLHGHLEGHVLDIVERHGFEVVDHAEYEANKARYFSVDSFIEASERVANLPDRYEIYGYVDDFISQLSNSCRFPNTLDTVIESCGVCEAFGILYTLAGTLWSSTQDFTTEQAQTLAHDAFQEIVKDFDIQTKGRVRVRKLNDDMNRYIEITIRDRGIPDINSSPIKIHDNLQIYQDEWMRAWYGHVLSTDHDQQVWEKLAEYGYFMIS